MIVLIFLSAFIFNKEKAQFLEIQMKIKPNKDIENIKE